MNKPATGHDGEVAVSSSSPQAFGTSSSTGATQRKYRQRKCFEAFHWTGDRAALLAWLASLPVQLMIHDCGSTGDYLAGPDVLFNWTTIAADPKDPHDQPERVYGDRIERGQWIVLVEKSTWARGSALVGFSYTDKAFRALFEEV